MTLNLMKTKPLLASLLRIVMGVLAVCALGAIGYAVWQPGLEVKDGRHDRGANGIWLAHGWLGADSWFVDNGKQSEMARYRSPDSVKALASKLKAHGIKDVFPHLCPTDYKGEIAGVSPVHVETFLDAFGDFRVIPWVGGVKDSSVRMANPGWRKGFAQSISKLVADHPRLAGVQVNVEPLPVGTPEFLLLLEEVRAAMPATKVLSVAAYPPPTRWHPFPEIHWDESYFREVSRRCDQMAVMMYDAGQDYGKAYQHLMRGWTSEVLQWSEGAEVLLGVPAYHDAGVGYHNPKVENIPNALKGIHRGLEDAGLPSSYQGIAIYSEWETSDDEWQYLKEHFLKAH
ncbi:hypothetical protein DES53_103102 [Roseimicrobium gellanilyticum]|uniref:Glycosyl hydrolase family 18 (Putative chitinase) n=2 Tax=Roseimicrobium gellanilyticum TaxID=748857 RepID=A0A366HNN1_9BACT|nr:hypothetical protein DES53_103102 [Roseimicrobium gellanilyticum]